MGRGFSLDLGLTRSRLRTKQQPVPTELPGSAPAPGLSHAAVAASQGYRGSSLGPGSLSPTRTARAALPAHGGRA